MDKNLPKNDKIREGKGYPNLKRDEYPRVLTCTFLPKGGWVPLTYKTFEYTIYVSFEYPDPPLDAPIKVFFIPLDSQYPINYRGDVRNRFLRDPS